MVTLVEGVPEMDARQPRCLNSVVKEYVYRGSVYFEGIAWTTDQEVEMEMEMEGERWGGKDLHSICLKGMGLCSPVLGVRFDCRYKYCWRLDNMKMSSCSPHLDWRIRTNTIESAPLVCLAQCTDHLIRCELKHTDMR